MRRRRGKGRGETSAPPRTEYARFLGEIVNPKAADGLRLTAASFPMMTRVPDEVVPVPGDGEARGRFATASDTGRECNIPDRY